MPTSLRSQPSRQASSDSGPHLKISEIAKRWNVSSETARRIFRREPGVLTLGEKNAHMRIPRSVLARVEEARDLHAG
jgi:hypothetical protein